MSRVELLRRISIRSESFLASISRHLALRISGQGSAKPTILSSVWANFQTSGRHAAGLLRASSKLSAAEGEEGEGEGALADVFTVKNDAELQLIGMLLDQGGGLEPAEGALAAADDGADGGFTFPDLAPLGQDAAKFEHAAPNWCSLPQLQQPPTPRLKRPVEDPSDAPRPPVRRRASPFDVAAQKPFIRHRGRDPAPPPPPTGIEPQAEWIPQLPQPAPPENVHSSIAITADNHRQFFAAVPDMVNTPKYMRITIDPQIKRKRGGGFIVQVGLMGRRDGSYRGSVRSLYDRINPSVITTGIPEGPPESPASVPEQDGQGPVLKEVVLVRKDIEGRVPDEVIQTTGPFSGDTSVIPSWIRWPGNWLFDVYCKVEGDGEEHWIKKTGVLEGVAVD